MKAVWPACPGTPVLDLLLRANVGGAVPSRHAALDDGHAALDEPPRAIHVLRRSAEKTRARGLGFGGFDSASVWLWKRTAQLLTGRISNRLWMGDEDPHGYMYACKGRDWREPRNGKSSTRVSPLPS